MSTIIIHANEFVKKNPFWGNILISIVSTLQINLINTLSSAIVKPLILGTEKEIDMLEHKIFGKKILYGKIIGILIELLIAISVLYFSYKLLSLKR